MPAIPPGALIPWIEQRFVKLILDSVTQKPLLVPNAMGTVQSFASDGTTPKPTFSTSDLEAGLENPVIIQLDDDGRPPTNIYMGRGGYTFVVKASDGTTLYTVSCEDTAGSFLSNFGSSMSEGAKNVTNNYQAQPGDHYITTDPNEVTDPATMILPDRTTWEGAFLIIKNKSTVTWQLTPFGTQTIDGVPAAVLLGPATGGVQPTIMFLPVAGGWDIVSATSSGGFTLPANLAYLNVAQTWTAHQTFSTLGINSGTFHVGGHAVTVTADCTIPSASGGGDPLPPNLAYLNVDQQHWSGHQQFDTGLHARDLTSLNGYWVQGGVNNGAPGVPDIPPGESVAGVTAQIFVRAVNDQPVQLRVQGGIVTVFQLQV